MTTLVIALACSVDFLLVMVDKLRQRCEGLEGDIKLLTQAQRDTNTSIRNLCDSVKMLGARW